jgi:hypothetical protein
VMKGMILSATLVWCWAAGIMRSLRPGRDVQAHWRAVRRR